MADLVRDPGLQPERTALAWRRTSLALVIATLVIARLTFLSLGASTVVPSLLVGAGALWVGILALRRRGVPHDDEPHFTSMLPDGRLPLLVAAIAAALCLGELLGVLTQLLR